MFPFSTSRPDGGRGPPVDGRCRSKRPSRLNPPVPTFTCPVLVRRKGRPRLQGLGELSRSDRCCIDKTSSAELSEAINSMYLWYQEAALCYAYLPDVPSNDPSTLSSQLAESKWFTRGWTLQELLAPSTVYFYGEQWVELGTKASLHKTISRITGIPDRVLLMDPLAKISVAMRMSWASKRRTTRLEDMAYCLMGIFRVNMPTLYGEGEKAFARLQQEIIKVSEDHSIFAWSGNSTMEEERGPFARSPAESVHCGQVVPHDYNERKSRYELTNFGLHIELPLRAVPDDDGEIFAALLNCQIMGGDRPLEILLRKKRTT